MATIVEMINPLTGLPEQVDKLDHTAQEIDDAVDLAPQLSSPNLLDNWYFGNPVNQRNVSGTIDTVGYFLDRWKLVSGSVTIGSNGITLNGTIVQILETEVGTDVTASALTTEGVVVASYDNNSKTISLTGTGQTFVAAKLELCSTQTLAHQDADRNWVLNEIPDFGEQLARCQRYFQRIVVPVATSFIPIKDNSISYQCNLPVQMRAEPSVTCGTFFIVNRNNDSAVFSENFVTPIKQSASVNSVIISIEKTQPNPVTVGKSGVVYVGSYYDDPGTRIIDCTADL